MSVHSIWVAIILLFLAASLPYWPEQDRDAAQACHAFVGLSKPGEPRRLVCDETELLAALGDCALLEPIHVGDDLVFWAGDVCFVERRLLPASILVQLGLPLALNEASMQDLQQIDGIGPAMAQKLVEARPFADWPDLERVKGVGPNVLRRLRPHLTLEPLPLLQLPAPDALTLRTP